MFTFTGLNKVELLELQQQAVILASAHDAVIVWDAGDRIILWNRGAEEMYGWAAEEALGKNVHELLRTESVETLERRYARASLQKATWKGS